jgi:hypothetical protein
VAPVVDVYLEVGSKRVFAGALDWPGWSRSGRDQDAALRALVDYAKRYRASLRGAGPRLEPPTDPSALRVVERLRGDATTDFGAPGAAPAADDRPLDEAEVERQTSILRASWAAFDRAAEAAAGAELRKGPRGGGRELQAMVDHVLGAEAAYLSKLGGRWGKAEASGDVAEDMVRVRAAILDVLRSRARGEPPPRIPRSGSLWAPRYFVRRSSWHALDHAWEIEDRAGSAV